MNRISHKFVIKYKAQFIKYRYMYFSMFTCILFKITKNKPILLNFRLKKFLPFFHSLFCTFQWAVPQSDYLMCLLVKSWFLLPKTWLLSLSLFHPHPKFDWIFHLTNLKKQMYTFLNRKTTNLFTTQAEHF